MLRKRLSLFLAFIIVSCCLTTVAAESSTVNFKAVTYASNEFGKTNSVSYDGVSNTIASSYGKTLDIHSSTDYSHITKFDFTKDVIDVAYSPDGEYIAVSLTATEIDFDSVVLVNTSTMSIESQRQRGNNMPSNIAWTYDSSKFAVANFDQGVNIYSTENSQIIHELNGQHSIDVSCIAFSPDSQNILTGDKDGLLIIWDAENGQLVKEINFASEITGCGFNTQNQKFAVSTVEGNVSSFTSSGSYLQSIQLDEVSGLLWSQFRNILYVLEDGSRPEMISLDGSSFARIDSTKLFHNAKAFDIKENQNTVVELYAATDTNHLAIYGTPPKGYGYGNPGSDLDGDNIPDEYDLDDDGDSFLDEWDFNCPEEELCSRIPDEDNIRRNSIEITNDKLIFEDTYIFNYEDTFNFRNLTKRSIIEDQQINYDEKNLFEQALCHNMDSEYYLDKMVSNLELSQGQLANGSIVCYVESGLAFAKTFDQSPIIITIKTTYDIMPNVTFPMQVTLLEQLNFADFSVLHLVENHPIMVTTYIDGQQDASGIWWKNSGVAELNFTSVNQEKSEITNIVNTLMDNISIVIGSIIFAIGLVWVLMRKKNLDSLILDEEEFDEENDGHDTLDDGISYEIEEETYSKPKPIGSEMKSLDYEDEIVLESNLKTEESPLERKAFNLNDDEFVEKKIQKRRVGKVQRNKQGPIMSTKRKRLDGQIDIPGKQIITNNKPLTRKTRKVKKVKKE